MDQSENHPAPPPELRFQALAISLAQVGTFEWDLERNVVLRSPTVAGLCGRSPAQIEATYEGFLALLHPEDRELHRKAMRRAIQEQVDVRVEYRVLWPDESVRWLLTRATLVRDRAGKGTYLVGTVQDVTDLKQAETQRDKITDSARCILWSADVEEVGHPDYLHWNAQFSGSNRLRRFLPIDVQPGESFQSAFYRARLKGDRERCDAYGTAAVRAGRSYGQDFRVRLSNGAVRWLHEDVTVETVEPGRRWKAYGVCLDVTERRETEEALRESEARYRALNADLEERVTRRTEALERAAEEINAFTYSVSHDMRTPLRGIVGNARILRTEHTDQIDSEGARLLERIEAGALKMSRLLDDLLAYARLGRQELSREAIDVSVRAAVVARRLLAEGEICEGARIEIQPGIVVHGDPRLLEMVLECLMDNACKYRKEGLCASIAIGAEPGGFFVRDEGIGFDMRYVDKLFEPFERLHRDDAYPGTGIGLAHVSRIVDRHGGRVWAEGSPGQGATFHVQLP